MEMKMGSSTSGDVSRASTAHYNLENQVMDMVRTMTLGGKQRLVNKMAEVCADCEKEAKN